jgi:hypothetical protein
MNYVGIPKRLIDEFQQLHFRGRFLNLFDNTRMLERRRPITTILELGWQLVTVNEVQELRQLGYQLLPKSSIIPVGIGLDLPCLRLPII